MRPLAVLSSQSGNGIQSDSGPRYLEMKRCALGLVVGLLSVGTHLHATTKGLSQIVTPELQPEGDLSLSLQIQDARIANPYELQAELGVTKWAEVAVFQGFKPNEEIFATEFGILTKEPWLL